MSMYILPLLVEAATKFQRVPGQDAPEETYVPGEKSMTVIVEGAYDYLNTGLVTLVILPVLAVALYRTGFRVAGPLVGLFTLGLFLAKMFGSPA